MVENILACDRDLLLNLNFDGGVWLDNIMWYFTKTLSFVLLVVTFFFLVWKSGKLSWKYGVVLILSLALIILLADQTSNFFKYNLPKFRPTHEPLLEGLIHTVRGYKGGLYGTVSAHAANGFGLATFMALVYRKKWFTTVAIAYVSVIAYTRIYLGVHYPLDIFFGIITGVLYGWIVYKIMSKIMKNREFINK